MVKKYRDGLKGGPVLLCNSHSGPGRNFSQPRDHLVVYICILYILYGLSVLRKVIIVVRTYYSEEAKVESGE